MTETVLQEAERIINGDRAKEYGDVSVNFARIGNMWGAYVGLDFTPHDVAQMMILVKVARQADGYHRDSNVDIAGYAALDEQVQPPKRTPKRDLNFSINVNADNPYSADQMYAMRYVAEHGVAPKPAPRQWESLAEVPHELKVYDREHDMWSFEYSDLLGRDSWGFTKRGGSHTACDTKKHGIQAWDSFAPFTESLEDK